MKINPDLSIATLIQSMTTPQLDSALETLVDAMLTLNLDSTFEQIEQERAR